MLPLLVLAVVGLAGAYWFLHNDTGVSTFWQLAGLGVFVMFMLVGVGFLAQSLRVRRR